MNIRGVLTRVFSDCINISPGNLDERAVWPSGVEKRILINEDQDHNDAQSNLGIVVSGAIEFQGCVAVFCFEAKQAPRNKFCTLAAAKH